MKESLPLDAGRPRGIRSKLAVAWELVRDTGAAWVEDYAASMGAALSYYTLFSLAPLLIIVISVAGMVFGAEAAQGEIFSQLRGMLGDEGATAIEGLLKSVESSEQGPLATAIGGALLFLGATSVFGELQDALDRIWRNPVPKAQSAWWSLARARLLSFGAVLALGFLLIVSLVVSAGLAAWGRWWSPVFSGWAILAETVNVVFSFVLVTALFAFIYKFLPRVRIAWRDVFVGAAVTASLFTLGKFLVGLYIGGSGVVSGFGAASSIVVILVWVYYSAQIFLAGAEFTWVYAHRYGSRRADHTTPGGPVAGTAIEPQPDPRLMPPRVAPGADSAARVRSAFPSAAAASRCVRADHDSTAAAPRRA